MLSTFKEITIAVFIFCIILFLYLHIQFHLKTSNDLEIYEIDQASKDKVEEICDLRQPVLLDFPTEENMDKILNTTNAQFLLDNYPIFEIKIKNQKESLQNTDNELYVPLTMRIAMKLFNDDKTATYFSEGNNDFLQETGAVKNMSYNDEFLRPYFVSNCYYDVLLGSSNVETPLKYDLNYRNYYVVTQGSLRIKLSPPKSSKYLYPIHDYENFVFKSPINVWTPQQKYKADFDKIKCLEIILTPGKILHIPAYWWYSFKFSENTSVSCFKYRTYMNNVAISPKICLYALQNQNIEHKIARKIDIKELQSNPKNDSKIIEHTEPNEIDLFNNNNNANINELEIGETPINNDSLEVIVETESIN